MAEPLLTSQQVADQLAMTIGALAQLRYLGRGPRFVRLTPRSIRYRQADVDAWVAGAVGNQDSETSKPQAS